MQKGHLVRLKEGDLSDGVAEKVAHLAALQYQADHMPGEKEAEEEGKNEVSL